MPSQGPETDEAVSQYATGLEFWAGENLEMESKWWEAIWGRGQGSEENQVTDPCERVQT